MEELVWLESLLEMSKNWLRLSKMCCRKLIKLNKLCVITDLETILKIIFKFLHIFTICNFFNSYY